MTPEQIIKREFGDSIPEGPDEMVYCPHCVDPHRDDPVHYHLGIHVACGIWHCFRCDRSGTLSGLLRKIGHSRAEADAIEKEFLGDKRPRSKSRKIKIDRTEQPLPPEFISLPTKAVLPYVQSYLDKRQITLQDCLDYSMGWCATGRYAGRLVLPVKVCGKIRTFVARDMLNRSKRKYLHPSGASLSHYLYGIDLCVTNGDMVITEGPLDAVRYGPGAVSLFGKCISDRQFSLIEKWQPGKIIVCLDSDAWPDSLAMASRLELLFDGVRVVKLPEGHDPGSLPRAFLRRYILRHARLLKEKERWCAARSQQRKMK